MISNHVQAIGEQSKEYIFFLTETLGLKMPDEAEQAEVWKSVHEMHFLFPNLSEKQRALLHALAVSCARSRTNPGDARARGAVEANRQAVIDSELYDEMTPTQQEFVRTEYFGE
jgi:hypothetical protein